MDASPPYTERDATSRRCCNMHIFTLPGVQAEDEEPMDLLDADSQALLSMLAASQPTEPPLAEKQRPTATSGFIFDPREVRKATATVRSRPPPPIHFLNPEPVPLHASL